MNQETLQNWANEAQALLEENTILMGRLRHSYNPEILDPMPVSVEQGYVKFVLDPQDEEEPFQNQVAKYLIPGIMVLAREFEKMLCRHIVTEAHAQEAVISVPSGLTDCLKVSANLLISPRDGRSLILTEMSEREALKLGSLESISRWDTFFSADLTHYNLYFHHDAVELTTCTPIPIPGEVWSANKALGFRVTAEKDDRGTLLTFDFPISFSPLRPGYCVLIPEEDFHT
jgi:hypothetical protein